MITGPVIKFNQKYNRDKVLEEFICAYYGCQLNYFASDLLENGLSPQDIIEAIRRAMVVCKTAGHDVQEHFLPIYSSQNQVIIRDCKLSGLGFKLVMLNARADNPAVASFQMKLLRQK